MPKWLVYFNLHEKCVVNYMYVLLLLASANLLACCAANEHSPFSSCISSCDKKICVQMIYGAALILIFAVVLAVVLDRPASCS
jgi:hypothetical protein